MAWAEALCPPPVSLIRMSTFFFPFFTWEDGGEIVEVVDFRMRLLALFKTLEKVLSGAEEEPEDEGDDVAC